MSTEHLDDGGLMSCLPAEAIERRRLHDMVHARPVMPLQAPVLMTSLAMLHGTAEQTAEAESAAVLRSLKGYGVRADPLDPGFVHLATPMFTARWERHGEFSVYSLARPIRADHLSDDPDADLPPVLEGPTGWLNDVPGTLIVAIQFVVLRAAAPLDLTPDDEHVDGVRRLLGPERLLGSRIRDTDARLFTTYRLRPDGTLRLVLVVGPEVAEARIGRIVAGMTDLEFYRVLGLRAFPQARAVHGDLGEIEQSLAALTESIDADRVRDKDLLHELLSLASRVQSTAAACDTRFSAACAYFGIVTARIADLKGTSAPGLTGVFSYLERRLTPAMATVEAASRRLGEVSGHTTRTADLLRTRVGIGTEAQNTALLRALHQGQRSQLRLQETVEGLSIAAISYYVIGLVGYLLKGVKGAGVHLNMDIATAIAIPIVVVAVWMTLRWTKRRLGGDDD